MQEQFSRTQLLLGEEGVSRLALAHVCVFGVGGVGGFAVEALARAGVGTLTIVDNDTVAASNINRQIIATWDTVGQLKVDAFETRILSINPSCTVIKKSCFYLPETRDQFDFSSYDYVVDAIDTVTGKLDIAVACHEAGTPLISSMGAGNKLDPTRFEVADINDTSVCRLARVMRRELRKRGVPSLKCVYSKEEPIKVEGSDKARAETGRSVPGSISFVPSVAGLILAGQVIKDLAQA